MRFWIVVAILLAGCSSGSTPDIDVAADRGLIRGVVIDPSITPVPDVLVRLRDGPETRSDAEGAFVFTGLEAGTYFLEASKAGFGSVQASTEVKAGLPNPPVLKIQMEPDPELVPFALADTYTGWIACEALVAFFLEPCDAGSGIFSEPDNTLFLSAADQPANAIQVEIMWDAQQAGGQRLTQTIGSCDGGAYCDPFASENFLCQNWGASPLWCRIGPTGADGNGHFCCAEGLETQGHGKGTGTGVGIHIGADCSVCADPVDPSMGIGVVFEQEITAYLWSFYNFDPAEGWLFVQDGEPTP